MQSKWIYISPIGEITLLAGDDGLNGAWLEGQKYFGGIFQIENIDLKKTEVMKKAETWLEAYFKGEQKEIEISLKPQGTEFQTLVWRHLAEIPYGELMTYGEIAKKIEMETGKKSSPRAVGSAVGHNPIMILLPCHRVISKTGNISGYAAGVECKEYLLNLEKAKS